MEGKRKASCMMCIKDLGYLIPIEYAVICAECRQEAQDIIDELNKKPITVHS